MTGTGAPFDDNDPEDAYDAGDAVVPTLNNLVRRLEWLGVHPGHPDYTGHLARLLEDLATIRDRIANGAH